jgi:hypothetical protein
LVAKSWEFIRQKLLTPLDWKTQALFWATFQ